VSRIRRRCRRSGREVAYETCSQRWQWREVLLDEDGWMAGNDRWDPPFAAVEAKVQRPLHRDGLIVRTRLVEALATTPERISLVQVTAPAGYGKTTALSQWAAEGSRESA